MLSSNERIDQETALKTFDLYAVGWLLDKRETIRPKTAQLYAGIIDQHLTPYLGVYALKDITPNVVKAWRRWMIGRFRAGTPRERRARLRPTVCCTRSWRRRYAIKRLR